MRFRSHRKWNDHVLTVLSCKSTKNGIAVARDTPGDNRCFQASGLGIKPKRTVLKEVDVPSPVQWVLSRNVHRRHLSSSQRSVVAAKAMPMVEGEAMRRKIEGNRAGGQKSKRGSATKSTAKNENNKLVAIVPPTYSVEADLSVAKPEKKSREPKTRDVVAKAVGVSGRNVQKAKVVVEGGSKDLVASVESGELTVSLAQKLVKSGARVSFGAFGRQLTARVAQSSSINALRINALLILQFAGRHMICRVITSPIFRLTYSFTQRVHPVSFSSGNDLQRQDD